MFVCSCSGVRVFVFLRVSEFEGSIAFVFTSACMWVCVCVCVVCLRVCRFVCLCNYVSVSLSKFVYVYLGVCL